MTIKILRGGGSVPLVVFGAPLLPIMAAMLGDPDRPSVHPLEGAGSRRAAVGLGIAGVSAGVTVLFAQLRERRVDRTALVVDVLGGGDFDDLETAIASVAEDTTIHVRAGRFVIERGNMSPAAGVHVVGEGYATHVILRPGTSQNVFRCEAPHVVLDNLRIDGDGTRQEFASGNCVMFSEGAHGSAVIDCDVEAASGYNIVAFPGCREVIIAGNSSSDALEVGIELQGASSCTVAGNVVRNARQNGILLWGSTGDCAFNTVTANTVVGCREFGVLVQDGAHDNTIAGNTITDSRGFGVIVDDTTVSGRAARGTTNPYRATESRDCFGTVIQGNVIVRSGRDGIRLNGATRCSVAGNIVRQSGDNGINVATARGCVLQGNVVTGNGGDGIVLDGPGSACTANVVYSNGRAAREERGAAGIVLGESGDGSVIVANRCFAGSEGEQDSGILTMGDTGEAMLVANVLLGNRRTPVSQPDEESDRLHICPHRRIVVEISGRTTRVVHGLGYSPRSVTIVAHQRASVWQARPSDREAVYLQTDGEHAVAEILIA